MPTIRQSPLKEHPRFGGMMEEHLIAYWANTGLFDRIKNKLTGGYFGIQWSFLSNPVRMLLYLVIKALVALPELIVQVVGSE